MSTLKDRFEDVPNDWKVLRLAAGDTPDGVKLPVGPVLVPLAVWHARRAELIRREYDHGWPLGVWLGTEESPAAIEQDIDDFTVVGVEPDKTGDRFHSVWQSLENLGYRGALTITA
ncbi:hypothetical protein GALL_07390 [mine drainage metagenome]|uniref:Uncharacterized protein n=1 Tax=mine drainage metagenome TaxID=410659 RepID=A0A1J5TG04_9ZZZZ